MPSLSILRNGTYTSLQSRTVGKSFYGFSPGGPQDPLSSSNANLCLGNDPNHPVIECCLSAPTIRFDSAATIYLSGANMHWKIKSKELDLHNVVHVMKGDILEGSASKNQKIAYIAIQSESITKAHIQTDTPYIHRNILRKGDKLIWKMRTKTQASISHGESKPFLINLKRGPEFLWLTHDARQNFKNGIFKISKENDRIGLKLVGPTLHTIRSFDWSVPVLPGFIQVTPSGQLIVLNRDAQTTGGYPRVAFMDNESLSSLTQKKSGDSIHWKWLKPR